MPSLTRSERDPMRAILLWFHRAIHDVLRLGTMKDRWKTDHPHCLLNRIRLPETKTGPLLNGSPVTANDRITDSLWKERLQEPLYTNPLRSHLRDAMPGSIPGPETVQYGLSWVPSIEIPTLCADPMPCSQGPSVSLRPGISSEQFLFPTGAKSPVRGPPPKPVRSRNPRLRREREQE